jgi:hypothetical protein
MNNAKLVKELKKINSTETVFLLLILVIPPTLIYVITAIGVGFANFIHILEAWNYTEKVSDYLKISDIPLIIRVVYIILLICILLSCFISKNEKLLKICVWFKAIILTILDFIAIGFVAYLVFRYGFSYNIMQMLIVLLATMGVSKLLTSIICLSD